eukprot:SAG11_NODE_2828_length_2935_cov_3.086389_2_plen_148_part_00
MLAEPALLRPRIAHRPEVLEAELCLDNLLPGCIYQLERVLGERGLALARLAAVLPHFADERPAGRQPELLVEGLCAVGTRFLSVETNAEERTANGWQANGEELSTLTGEEMVVELGVVCRARHDRMRGLLEHTVDHLRWRIVAHELC